MPALVETKLVGPSHLVRLTFRIGERRAWVKRHSRDDPHLDEWGWDGELAMPAIKAGILLQKKLAEGWVAL